MASREEVEAAVRRFGAELIGRMLDNPDVINTAWLNTGVDRVMAAVDAYGQDSTPTERLIKAERRAVLARRAD